MASCYEAPEGLFYCARVTNPAGILPSGVRQRHQTAVRRLRSQAFEVVKIRADTIKCQLIGQKAPEGFVGGACGTSAAVSALGVFEL